MKTGCAIHCFSMSRTLTKTRKKNSSKRGKGRGMQLNNYSEQLNNGFGKKKVTMGFPKVFNIELLAFTFLSFCSLQFRT